jgi:hypothetical protein
MAGSLEKIAGIPPGQRIDDVHDESAAATPTDDTPEVPPTIATSRITKERAHA